MQGGSSDRLAQCVILVKQFTSNSAAIAIKAERSDIFNRINPEVIILVVVDLALLPN